MLTFQALALAGGLGALLRPGSVWQVFQRFPHGINLSCGLALIFLSGPASPLCPFGIRIQDGDLDRLLPRAAIGQSFACVGEALLGASCQISWGGTHFTPVFQAAVPSTPEGLVAWIGRQATVLPPCADFLSEWASRFSLCLRQGGEELHTLFRQIIGYGPGLTPSGDDFLVGLLWAHAWHPFLPDACLEVLHKSVFLRQSTTLTALNYYRHALEKRFSQPLLLLGTALAQGRWEEADAALQDLLGLGHTSGLDTWLGARTGLGLLLDGV